MGMKKELADYMNRETKKLKAKQPLRMSSIPAKDVFALRDIIGVILGDDELRKQFRICAGVSTAEMKRAEKSLNVACNEYLDHDLANTAAMILKLDV